MMWSRILAVVVVVAATLWIGSGVFGRTESPANAEQAEAAPAQPLFRVAVIEAKVESHARSTALSGRTEADDRASAVARTTGTILELNVRRGDRVNEGDVIAVLSDEAREAQVAEAEALFQQRRTDLDAKLKLIKRGIIAANQKSQLESDLRAAEAALAAAEAEQERGQIRAPITGMVSELPMTAGQAVEPGASVAQIVALDPMLAVVEVAERQLAGLKVGDSASVKLVTGETAEGAIRFISPTASEGTRTYRLEVELDNRSGAIRDGITAEVELRLAAADAVRIPRSALTFSAEGQLSVRTVSAEGAVGSVPVRIVEDGREEIWVAGPRSGDQVIVQGQDFVKDGQRVEAVGTGAPALISRS
ncbi:MAG: efflux RND transporter periplasmic adaptor subunit [Rhizobiales bacterium]|nr:efflux RND transporter periplasmic adaptor subunit [Hyphomicrobiales bacterium]